MAKFTKPAPPPTKTAPAPVKSPMGGAGRAVLRGTTLKSGMKGC